MASTNYIATNGVIRAQLTDTGTLRGYATDALGSIVATTSAGAVENTYRYKPYGAQLAKTGTAADPKFTWVGSEGYRQTGLAVADAYVRARHYSSSTAHWTTVDPMWPFDPSYGYASTNPTGHTDPSGLLPCSRPCCCQVNSASQRSHVTHEYAGRPFWGHKLTTKVSMSNVYAKTPPKDKCKIKWYEKTDHHYVKGMLDNTWTDVCKVPRLNCPEPTFNATVPTNCPEGPKVWTDSDYPGFPHMPGTGSRMLCIKVVVTDGCTGNHKVLRWNQFLSIRDGKLISIVPPGQFKRLHDYCSV